MIKKVYDKESENSFFTIPDQLFLVLSGLRTEDQMVPFRLNSFGLICLLTTIIYCEYLER